MCNCSGCCARGPQGPSETSKVYFEEYTTARDFLTPYTSPDILATGVLTFTIAEAGTYRLTAVSHYLSATEGTINRAGIEKNGTVLGVYVDETIPAANYTGTRTFLKEEDLIVGDVISFVFGCTSGVTDTVNISSSLLIEKLNN